MKIWKDKTLLINITYTVKLVYNDHSRDLKYVVVVDRWSLFRGSFMLLRLWDSKMSLWAGGSFSKVVVSSA